jgi:hypothetical protein
VPLEGGVLLDLTNMTAIEWQKPGVIRCEPGLKMNDLDAATRPNGFELRMHPSTKRMATIGGFVGGGSGGIGSVNYGGLREPGNISGGARGHAGGDAARDRAAHRRGAEGQPRLRHHRHHHGAGNAARAGLAVDRRDRAFDDFFDAMQFGYDVALADGIVKKLLTPMIWPIPQHFNALKAHCPRASTSSSA